MRRDGLFATFGAWAVAGIGAAAWFLVSSLELPVTAWPLVLCIGLLGAVLASAWQVRRGDAFDDRKAAGMAAGGGIAAFWAAPAIVLSQRASDVPSGSETLFFSVVGFGLVAVLISPRLAWRQRVTAYAASAVSAVGAACLLANWERPSSFSPLVRWPERELAMLAAAVVFAVGSVLVSRAQQRTGRPMSAVAIFPASLVGAIAAVPAVASGSAASLGVSGVLLPAAAFGAMAAGWLAAIRRLGVAGAAGSWLLAPALITTLILAEKAAGVRGTDPIVWKGAVAGLAVSVVGAVVLLLVSQSSKAPDGGRGPASERRSRLLGYAGAAAALAAAVSLAMPAIRQTAAGVAGSQQSFSASWIVYGYQSGAGWAVFSAGLCALAAAVAMGGRGASLRAGLAAVMGTVALFASRFLGDSTFATWNSWVPADVQQAYGTEYARLSIEGAAHPLRTFSAGFSLIVIAVSIATLLIGRRRSGTESEERS